MEAVFTSAASGLYPRMKKLVVLVFLLAAAGLGSAGSKAFRQVYIGSTNANGSLGAARASADTMQMIGCWVYGNEAYNYKSVSCYARNAYGDSATCYSSVPTLVDIAGQLNGDSFLSFSFNAPSTDCMSIQVQTFSTDEPKQ